MQYKKVQQKKKTKGMKEESNLAKKRDWLNELFNKWSSPVMSQEKKNSLGKEAI